MIVNSLYDYNQCTKVRAEQQFALVMEQNINYIEISVQ